MKVPGTCDLKIIDDPAQLVALVGAGSTNKFVMVLTQGDQSVVLPANLAAMVHGAVRGVWERVYGEKLPA